MAKDGVVGLWKGASPAVLRQMAMTSSQCVVYEEVKHALLNWGLPKNDLTFMLAGGLTGIASTTAMCPADVVKTLMYTGNSGSLMGGIADVYAKEGLMGFMKGWVPAYLRLGPQTLIMFTIAEHVRALFGLSEL